MYYLEIPLKTQKWKKANRDEKNDNGEENKIFLKLILLSIKRINLNILLRGAYSPHPTVNGPRVLGPDILYIGHSFIDGLGDVIVADKTGLINFFGWTSHKEYGQRALI